MFRMWRGKRRTRPGKNPTTAPPTTKQSNSHFRGELGNAGTLSRAQGGDTLEDALAHLRRCVFFVFPHRPGSWTPRDPLRGSMRVSPRSFPPPRRAASVHDTSATTIRVSREKRFVRIATHYDSVAKLRSARVVPPARRGDAARPVVASSGHPGDRQYAAECQILGSVRQGNLGEKIQTGCPVRNVSGGMPGAGLSCFRREMSERLPNRHPAASKSGANEAVPISVRSSAPVVARSRRWVRTSSPRGSD